MIDLLALLSAAVVVAIGLRHAPLATLAAAAVLGALHVPLPHPEPLVQVQEGVQARMERLHCHAGLVAALSAPGEEGLDEAERRCQAPAPVAPSAETRP